MVIHVKYSEKSKFIMNYVELSKASPQDEKNYGNTCKQFRKIKIHHEF